MGPPPPRYTEIDAYLRSEPRGGHCIQGNIIQADLTESFLDIDLDGDGRRERVSQVRDCLVVSAQRTGHWDVTAIVARRVDRDVETVRLRPGPSGSVEVVDSRGTNRQVSRFRWQNNDLVPAP